MGFDYGTGPLKGNEQHGDFAPPGVHVIQVSECSITATTHPDKKMFGFWRGRLGGRVLHSEGGQFSVRTTATKDSPMENLSFPPLSPGQMISDLAMQETSHQMGVKQLASQTKAVMDSIALTFTGKGFDGVRKQIQDWLRTVFTQEEIDEAIKRQHAKELRNEVNGWRDPDVYILSGKGKELVVMFTCRPTRSDKGNLVTRCSPSGLDQALWFNADGSVRTSPAVSKA